MEQVRKNRNRFNLFAFVALLVLMTLLLLNCGGRGGASSASDGKVEADIMTHASLLEYHEREGYDEAVVRDAADSSRVVARYVLLPRDADLPESLPEGAVVLRIPLRSAVVDSQVYVSALEETGGLDAVKGVFDAAYISTPAVKKGLADGSVLDVGSVMSPSNERLISLSPDAVLLSCYEGMGATDIDRLGFPVVRMTDSGERTPLGRAEWLRFIGRLTGHAAEADSIFSAVEHAYKGLADRVAVSGRQPKVLTETMYQGIWYVPGGRSYQARVISDAGGDYLWKDDESAGSLSLAFEQALERGRDADVWLIKVFGQNLSCAGLLAMDPRYAGFKAVDAGGVWYCNTAERPLFEEFPFHPERLLADYVAIFSGDGSACRYFSRMTP